MDEWRQFNEIYKKIAADDELCAHSFICRFGKNKQKTIDSALTKYIRIEFV